MYCENKTLKLNENKIVVINQLMVLLLESSKDCVIKSITEMSLCKVLNRTM